MRPQGYARTVVSAYDVCKGLFGWELVLVFGVGGYDVFFCID